MCPQESLMKHIHAAMYLTHCRGCMVDVSDGADLYANKYVSASYYNSRQDPSIVSCLCRTLLCISESGTCQALGASCHKPCKLQHQAGAHLSVKHHLYVNLLLILQGSCVLSTFMHNLDDSLMLQSALQPKHNFVTDF